MVVNAPPTTPAVRCRGLTVKYGSTVAARDVTFDVPHARVVGLVGPNGAGKTSVLRALTTIIQPAAGEARVAGFDLREAINVRERVGVLPESSGYPGNQTPREYLAYHGRLYGLTAAEARERALLLLQRSGLADRSEHRIRTFSRGMRQRLGTARALVNRPEVVILDEPTLGLDPAGQSEILAQIRDIAVRQGAAVVLTSHLLDEIERVCDSIVIMSRGAVVFTGTPEDAVRTAGRPRRVRVRVPERQIAVAVEALSGTPGVGRVETIESKPGELTVELADPEEGAAPVARALIDSNVELLELRIEGSRLNDAFLALTA